MKTRLLLSLGVIAPCLLLQNANARRPFFVVEQKSAGFAPVENVLYTAANSYVIRTEAATAEDFQNLYAVTLPFSVSKDELGKLANVMHFESGKFAIVQADDENAAKISGWLHGQGMACGVMTKLTGSTISMAAPITATPIISVDITNPTVAKLVAQISADKINASVGEISNLHTRYHKSATGIGVASMLKDKYLAMAGNRTDVEVEIYNHTDTPQPSLVVRIVGQTRSDEIVVLGSHIDSINYAGAMTKRAPGADDNASGTATNMEIFRVLMQNNIRPERTIEIHGYAAEEQGLVGSQEIAEAYSDAKKNVVSMVQFDMNIFLKNGTAPKIWFIESNTDRGLNNMLGKLLTNYTGIPWDIKPLFGGDSDHTSWRRAGYSSAFPFENPNAYNSNIHSDRDSIQNSGNFEQAKGFAQLGVSYVSHLAGLYSPTN